MMKQVKPYYQEYVTNRIRFYRQDSSREVKYRPRFSSMWVKNYIGHLPFRVRDYYNPTIFYNGIAERNKDIDCGYDKVKRGIWRNEMIKINIGMGS